MVVKRQRAQAGLYSAERIRDFFVQQKKEDLVKFLHEDVVSLAYLVDIFSRLNELNLSLQGQDKTIVNFIDALSAFQAKLGTQEKKNDNGLNGNVSYLK